MFYVNISLNLLNRLVKRYFHYPGFTEEESTDIRSHLPKSTEPVKDEHMIFTQGIWHLPPLYLHQCYDLLFTCTTCTFFNINVYFQVSEKRRWKKEHRKECVVRKGINFQVHNCCCLQYSALGLSRRLSGKPSTCQCRSKFNPWVSQMPWRRKWQPTPIFLPGESHGQTSLAGYSPWGCKSQTWFND